MQKQKKKRGQYQKKLAPKRNVQDLLRYEKMFESGICEIVPNYYSKSVRFSDVNYQIAQQDEQLLIFQRYGELLNSLDDTIHLTITILKKRVELDEMTDKLFYESKGDQHDSYREEVNQMLLQKINEGENRFTKLFDFQYSSQSLRAGKTIIGTNRKEFNRKFGRNWLNG